MANLGSRLLAQARKSPQNQALWSNDSYLTYAELFGEAGRMAAALAEAGIGAGDLVATLSNRTPQAYAGILGALLAGAAYVPLNPRFPLARNREILQAAGARALLCDDDHAEALQSLLADTQVKMVISPSGSGATPGGVRHLALADCPAWQIAERSSCESAAGRFAYLLFTSGSTGKPKGVPLSHDNVFAFLESIATLVRYEEDDRVLQLADLTFDLSVHDMFNCWLAGACLYSVPDFASLLATRIADEMEITAWMSVPSNPAKAIEMGLLRPGSLPSMRHAFFAGEALPGTLVEAWAEAAPNCRVFNGYGPTEATVIVSGFEYQPGQAVPPPVVALGHPFPGQYMGLFNADGTRAEGLGEICLSGSQVMVGYWQAPELTAERMFEAEGRVWYRTGDLGRFEPETGYQYAGRADHQVKIKGYRTELQEIEHVVRQVTGSSLAAIIPVPVGSAAGFEGTVGFVGACGLDEKAAIAAIAALLPEYMVPRSIREIEMPHNANGKIDYPALRKLAAQ